MTDAEIEKIRMQQRAQWSQDEIRDMIKVREKEVNSLYAEWVDDKECAMQSQDYLRREILHLFTLLD